MKIDVLGVEFDNVTMDEAVSRGAELLEGEKAAYVVTPNPEIVWLCRDDDKLKNIVNNAALCLPDGIGVIYGAKILGRPLKSKIPGIDFISALFEKAAPENKTVFLLGAKPGVAEKAAKTLEERYPGLKVCGTADGYFKDDEPIIDEINALAPDILLVCLGAPKQEYWMADNAERLNVKLMAGLGGSLDVFAGTVERAPEKWQKHGLEWLYRLKKEPKRIKRMIKLPLFIFAVIGQRLRGK
jgi:N-acetylglucosaminyldiphosphoundecaprenol N-acetyl-beta-D-mannosaminyltransferase